MATNSNSNSNSNSNDKSCVADDGVFRRDFAAALGKALREAEDAAPNKKRSQEELAQETYRLLCYDHPVGFTASGCRALSKALLVSSERSSSSHNRHNDNDTRTTPRHESSCYALSNRLVEGILQVSYRRAAAVQQGTPAEQADKGTTTTRTNDGDNTRVKNNNENIIEEEDSTFASSAFAALAWNVYGRIPLLCCLSSQLDEASSFLGSYRGSGGGVAGPVPAVAADNAALENGQHVNNNNAHDDPQDANLTTAQQQQQPALIMNGNGHAAPAAAPGGDDDLSEVWAAESDPSDFDFESDWNPEQNVLELDAWANELERSTDPMVQSMVPPNTTWTHVAQAVTNLIHELNYTKISGLSQHDWKTLKVSDHLTQLVVVLLLVPTEEERTTMSTTSSSSPSSGSNRRNNQYPLLNERDVYHWQQLALQPLHVFRDAVLSEHDGDANKEDDFILKDYLQLLQTLLQVEYNKRGGGCNSTVKRSNTAESLSQQQQITTTTVVPATWVGLSALSTMCSNCLNDMVSNNTSRRRIGVLRTAVLEASDDLCHILEQSAAGNSDAMRDAIPWTYLSLFQIFSATTISNNNNNNSVATKSAALPLPTLSNAQIQILLNSGLFRQWLLLWSKLRDGEAENSAVHGAVLQSIFDLCCVAPTLFGKYAWRFPGLAAFATAPPEVVLENESSSTECIPPLQPHRHHRLRSCFSWNLLGIRLAEETCGGSTSSPTVKWKSSSKAASSSSTASGAPPPTATLAQQRAWAAFQQLCANLSPVLSAWKERRCISSAAAADQKTLAEQRAEELALLRLVEDDIRCLSEFNAVIDSLSNPTLQTLFREKMTPATEKLEAGDGSSMILDLTLPIQQQLATWPSPLNIESGSKVKTDDSSAEETDHEATSPHQAMRRRVQMEESSINAVRRSIKVLKSMLESSPGQSSVGFSSKAD